MPNLCIRSKGRRDGEGGKEGENLGEKCSIWKGIVEKEHTETQSMLGYMKENTAEREEQPNKEESICLCVFECSMSTKYNVLPNPPIE